MEILDGDGEGHQTPGASKSPSGSGFGSGSLSLTELCPNIPPHAAARLHYLWETAHLTAISSPALSHTLAVEMAALIREHHIIVPDHLRHRFCIHCNGIQLPTITCQKRVVPNNKRTKHKTGHKNRVVSLSDMLKPYLYSDLVLICFNRCASAFYASKAIKSECAAPYPKSLGTKCNQLSVHQHQRHQVSRLRRSRLAFCIPLIKMIVETILFRCQEVAATPSIPHLSGP
jgi:RNase P subunit RPR2